MLHDDSQPQAPPDDDEVISTGDPEHTSENVDPFPIPPPESIKVAPTRPLTWNNPKKQWEHHCVVKHGFAPIYEWFQQGTEYICRCQLPIASDTPLYTYGIALDRRQAEMKAARNACMTFHNSDQLIVSATQIKKRKRKVKASARPQAEDRLCDPFPIPPLDSIDVLPTRPLTWNSNNIMNVWQNHCFAKHGSAPIFEWFEQGKDFICRLSIAPDTPLYAYGIGSDRKHAKQCAALNACMILHNSDELIVSEKKKVSTLPQAQPSTADPEQPCDPFPIPPRDSINVTAIGQVKWIAAQSKSKWHYSCIVKYGFTPIYEWFQQGKEYIYRCQLPVKSDDTPVHAYGIGPDRKQAELRAALNACIILHNSGIVKKRHRPKTETQIQLGLSMEHHMMIQDAINQHQDEESGSDEDTPLDTSSLSVLPDDDEGEGFLSPPPPPPPILSSVGPQNDERASAKILEHYMKNRSAPQMQKLNEARRNLPAFKLRDDFLRAVECNPIVVVCGETGCGKSTQLPQYIMESMVERGQGSACSIVVTQPRRISALALAERVAVERGESVGQSIGYQVRLESKQPVHKNKMLFCTTGILLRRMQVDPFLSNVSHCILDEVHERDSNTDFLLIILRDLIARRPNLRVILMSASLNAELFSSYMGGCPVIQIPGFTHPVDEYYLEDMQSTLSAYTSSFPPPAKRQKLDQGSKSTKEDDPTEIDYAAVEAIIEHIIFTNPQPRFATPPSTWGGPSAILVFLPGWEEIKKVNDRLLANPRIGGSDPTRCVVAPLHSALPTHEHQLAFKRPPRGARKVVLATNIAETSITIDDIVYVVDLGRMKEKGWDALNQASSLNTSWVSKANMKQRAGRAGRCQPGMCFRMFSRSTASQFQESQTPDILKMALDRLCLSVKSLNLGDIKSFILRALEPPVPNAIDIAIARLQELNALDENQNLTPLGYHLSTLPVEPHIGKMILFGAIFQCLDPILVLAATISDRPPFVATLEDKSAADNSKLQFSGYGYSDHFALLNAFYSWELIRKSPHSSVAKERDFCYQNFLSGATLLRLNEIRTQLFKLLCDIGFAQKQDSWYPIPPGFEVYDSGVVANINSGNEELVKSVLVAALYPSVGQFIHQKGKKAMFQSKKDSASIHPGSVLSRGHQFCDGDWVVFQEKIQSMDGRMMLRDVSIISPYPLLFFGGKVTVESDQNKIKVDDWIQFHMPAHTAHLVTNLRGQLNKLLSRKIKNPSMDLSVAGHSIIISLIGVLTSGQTSVNQVAIHQSQARKKDKFVLAAGCAPTPQT